MVGRALSAHLVQRSHTVSPLMRSTPTIREPGGLFWNPATGAIKSDYLDGFDVAIHLAGESIQGRWTPSKKTMIRDSRVNGTRLLCEALGRVSQPPKTI